MGDEGCVGLMFSHHAKVEYVRYICSCPRRSELQLSFASLVFFFWHTMVSDTSVVFYDTSVVFYDRGRSDARAVILVCSRSRALAEG